ncbi:major facilitator superfamily domain-containing protein [Trichoderma ceciliae]
MDSEKNVSGSTHHDHEFGIESDDVHHIGTNVFHKDVQTNHDDALDFLRATGDQTFAYTDQEAKRVRWKIDLMLMPLVSPNYCYMFGSIDMIISYMLGQPVNAYMLHKVPMGKWLAGNVLGWGICILLAITAKNFAGIATSRFFLGLFESVNNPAFVLITSQYYTRKEHSLRSCIWWAGNAVGSFFGDLVAYGIGHGHGPLSPWKYMFITFGGFTVLWSVILALFLPDSPWKMRFLTEQEKKIAVLRVISNHTGISASHWKWNQALSVFVDPQAWIFFCIAFIQCLPGGGLTAFNKLILTGLGYTNLQATIYSMPEHAIQLVGVIVACIIIVLSNIPPLVGSLIVYYVPASDKLTRLAGVYILFTNTISYIMVLSLVASNFAGMSRKTTVSAGIFLAYSAGNLVAPSLFIDSEAPLYPTGFRGMIASFITIILLAIGLMGYLVLQNKQRDNKYGKVDPNATQEDDLLDLTDKELHYFRYACNMRISLGAPPNGQTRDLTGTPHLEISPLGMEPDFSSHASDDYQHSPPELDVNQRATHLATLNNTDSEGKWQPESNTCPTTLMPQPMVPPILDNNTVVDGGQPPDGDLVGIDAFHISDLSDFNFSFESFFDKDIEFPSWPDVTFAMDGLDHASDDNSGGNIPRRIPEESTPYQKKRAEMNNSSIEMDEISLPHVDQDDAYLTHFERWIASCGYSLKEDGKGNYLRFVLDYIRSPQCGPESPFRFAVLAWAAKHLATTSISNDRTWRIYYSRAVEGLNCLSCCGDSYIFSEPRSSLSSELSVISSKAEITISSFLFLCRCDILNGDATSILHRLDNLKDHLACHLDGAYPSALACKFLLWLCYIDVRLRIFAIPTPPTGNGKETPITTLLDVLIHHPNYKQILSHSHSYLSEIFGREYPPEELVQDAKKVPVSLRTHETFCLISNMLQYRSWKYLATQNANFLVQRELAEAKETAINLDIRRMDIEFDLAIATNPAANALRNVATSPETNMAKNDPTNHETNSSLAMHSLPPTVPSLPISNDSAYASRAIDRDSLQWLSCYASFLAAKVLWSRFLYPTIRTDSPATIATGGILKIALRLRQIHRKSRLASLMKIPRSMLWPLPLFIAGIETTDEIYADWISEFMDEMASSMTTAARGRSSNARAFPDNSIKDKCAGLIDQNLILMLMMRVREKQDLLGRRVDVREVMSEIEGTEDIFVL